MHFLKGLAVFLSVLPLALSSPALPSPALSSPDLFKRDGRVVDGELIVHDIEQIKKNAITLNYTIYNWGGGFFGSFKLITILYQTSYVTNAMKTTLEDAKNAHGFNDTESFSISQAFTELLPVVQDVLFWIMARKVFFDYGMFGLWSLSSTVRAILISQQELSNQMGNEIIPKLTTLWASVGPLLLRQINNYFNEAINFF
uniref:Uncharacterized protein n=1 Tax=Talaromyces marneffei PM1 TaxID=1077442 RepID=A0A093VP89_TALMA